MKELTIAWAAGLFEGEGTIGKGSRTDKRRPGQQLPTYAIRVGMTDRDVIQRLQDNFGGQIYEAPDKRGNRKLMYRWYLSKKAEVKKLLQLMLPYFGLRRTYEAQNRLDLIDNC